MYNDSKSQEEVTKNNTIDYDYYIDENLESNDKDEYEYDYEEPEISTYWYDYYEEKITTFTTALTTIDLEQLQTEVTYTLTSEEIDVTPFVTLLSIIETMRTTELREPTLSFAVTEASSFVTTISIIESTTTEIMETSLPGVTTKFTIYTSISPSTTSESTTEATSMTMEYKSTLISITEVTIMETLPFLTVEEMTTWIENITESSLFEETELMITYDTITSVTTQSTMTFETSIITPITITESVNTTEFIEETEESEIITTITFTSPYTMETYSNITDIKISDFTSPTEILFFMSTITEYETIEFTETISSVSLESTTLSMKEEEEADLFTTEIIYTTFTITPEITTTEIIINITTVEEVPITTEIPTSTETTYTYIVSSLETSIATTESETYVFETTLATFVTYYVDRTVPKILETTIPLSFTISTEITTLTEEILEPSSTTTLSTLSITEESTSPAFKTIFISSIETTYSFTVFSLQTSAITESKTYVFVTTSATLDTYYADQILETTVSLPSTMLTEIITITEEILEPTGTTLSTLTEFSPFSESMSLSPLSEMYTLPTSTYSVRYTELEEEISTIVELISQLFTSTFLTSQEITLLDFEITIIPSIEITSTTLEEEIFPLITTPVIDFTPYENTSFTSFFETYPSTPMSFLQTDMITRTSSEATTTEEIVLFLPLSTTIDIFNKTESLKTLKTMFDKKMKTVTDSSEYEEFYDTEYGKDYEEAYEEDKYEDEDKSITTWYEYEEEEETTIFDRKTTSKFETTEIIEKETSKIIENKTVPIVSLTTKPILTEMKTITMIKELETSTTISETFKDFEKTSTTTSSVSTIEEFTLTSDKIFTSTTEHLEWWADQSSHKKHDHTLGMLEIESETKLDITLPKFIVSPDETTLNISLVTEIGTITQTEIFPTITDSSIYLEIDITTDSFDEKSKLFVTESEETDLKLYFTTPSDFVSLLTTDDFDVERRNGFEEETKDEVTPLFETIEGRTTVHSFEEDEDERV
ncbi:M cell-type agglutination protein mam3-like [Vespa velutina]|uniref:M cell-type agglutination protein mam3-like n=1 Tax=Vespa velutina TaxID=202808 RepID=UPI001FB4C3EC|nr:M cell-type agglutination protein mam3-like [Vespa velutina]